MPEKQDHGSRPQDGGPREDPSRNSTRDLSSDRVGQFDDARRGRPGGRQEREGGSGGVAGFFSGGHDQTGNWQGAREDPGRESGNYPHESYGQRHDEHGTFGSRERPNEYPHQGGTSATGGSQDHRGEGAYGTGYGRQQSPGQQSQPGYGSGEYAQRDDDPRDPARGAPNAWGSGGQGRGYGREQERGGQRSEGGGRTDYAGSHQGQPYGRDAERDYRSSQYGGAGRPGYSSQFGQGGGYGGGIHERDQSGQGRRDQFAQPGPQRPEQPGQPPTYGTQPSADWGREHHESGRQGGYGGVHDWNPGRDPQRADWQGGQEEPNRHRDWGHRDPGSRFGIGPSFGSGSSTYGVGEGVGPQGGPANPPHGGGAQPMRRRGPKNYQRSDERLRELISDRLLEDPHIDSSDVSVEVKSGEVILEGTVDDRRTKYQIEELVEHVHGVRDIDNRIRVKRGFLASLFGGGDDREDGRSRGDRDSGMTTSGSGSQTSASPTTSTTSLTGSTLSGGAAGVTAGDTSAAAGAIGGTGIGTEKDTGTTGSEKGSATDRDTKRSH
jgi:hypothetical protein